MTNYSVPKAVESQIRRISVFYPGKKLDRHDQDLFHDVLLLEYHLVEDLLPFDETALRQFRGFLGTSEIDILKYARTLKFSDSYLKNSFGEIGLGAERSLQSFKRSVKDANLYWGLMKPFEKVLIRFFESYEPCIFQLLNTWVNFSSRVNFHSLDLSYELQADYCQFEASMATWTYGRELIQEMRDVMSEWLKDLTMEHFVPKHGPGSVAGYNGRLPVLYKHQIQAVDRRLLYFCQKDVPYRLDECFPLKPSSNLSRVSELIFVPKTMIKNRTISKEPVSLQYFQQGAKRVLYQYFKDHTYLSSRIDLDRRELSQEAARQGSIRGSLDTLDLSNASDSVSLALIKSVFSGTSIYRALICTRSDSTRIPNGLVFRLNKFAPMGSALCFPIETLIFACVCEVASRRLGHKCYYRVYGDDIVCAKRLTEGIRSILAELHFELNTEKSFYVANVANFREACGGEYVNGIDVSPLRISRKFVSYDDMSTRKITSAETVQSFISFANNAFEKGLYNVRRGILSLLEARYPDYRGLMFGTDASHLNTFPDGLTNWKLKSRFRLKAYKKKDCYQKIEYRCVTSIAKCDNQALIDLRTHPEMNVEEEDSIRYFEYFRSRLDRDPYEGLQLNGLIIKKSAFQRGHLRICERADIYAFPPEVVDIRPSRTVMHWKWVYNRD